MENQKTPGSPKAGRGLDLTKFLQHPVVQQIQYMIARSGKYVDMALPYYFMAKDQVFSLYEIAKPYHPQYLTSILVGLILIYFGGCYMTVIAAVEAFRISSWDSAKKQLAILQENFSKAWEESRKDDQADDNGDGIADVEQISKEELIKRKALVFLRSIEPMDVYNAIGTLYVGYLAVVATLKIKFAQAITLGASIGEVIFNLINPYLQPALKKVLPEAYVKWSPVIVSYISKSTGISIAWTFQRILTSFHSALRGTEILAYGLQGWLVAMNIWRGDIDANLGGFAKIFGLGIVLTGVFWQITRAFQLPYILNILLFPLNMLEWWFMWVANS